MNIIVFRQRSSSVESHAIEQVPLPDLTEQFFGLESDFPCIVNP